MELAVAKILATKELFPKAFSNAIRQDEALLCCHSTSFTLLSGNATGGKRPPPMSGLRGGAASSYLWVVNA